jgi:hypothetical protein
MSPVNRSFLMWTILLNLDGALLDKTEPLNQKIINIIKSQIVLILL